MTTRTTVPLPNGCVRLGIQEGKRMLGAGIKPGDLARQNIILAIGERTARDGWRTACAGVASPWSG